MLCIRNGNIVTMANRLIENGEILAEDGKICAINDSCEHVVKPSDDVIDATDCFVFPGFIDAHSHIGLIDEGIGDMFVSSNPVTPLSSALHSMSFYESQNSDFHECVRSGITTVLTAPFGKNYVGGKCTLIKTACSQMEYGARYNGHRLLSEYCGMKFSLTAMSNQDKEHDLYRGFAPAAVRDELHAAQTYAEKKTETDNGVGMLFKSPAMEAYIPILSGEKTAFFDASTVEELRMSIKIIKQFNLRAAIIYCGTEKIDDDLLTYLLESKIPIISGPGVKSTTNCFASVKNFVSKGIQTAISTIHPTIEIKYLSICAGLAAKEGLSMDNALEAITSVPASILGFSDRIGSLEVGKDADIVIFDANPLEVFTKTLYTIIDGEIVHKNV